MVKKTVIQIARLREARGLTQAELARAIGSDVSTVRNLEKNRSGVKTIQRIVKLCQALECSVEDLVEMVDVGEISHD